MKWGFMHSEWMLSNPWPLRPHCAHSITISASGVALPKEQGEPMDCDRRGQILHLNVCFSEYNHVRLFDCFMRLSTQCVWEIITFVDLVGTLPCPSQVPILTFGSLSLLLFCLNFVFWYGCMFIEKFLFLIHMKLVWINFTRCFYHWLSALNQLLPEQLIRVMWRELRSSTLLWVCRHMWISWVRMTE